MTEEKNFEPLRRFFEKNGWEYETSPELEQNITVKQKGNMFLYNYNDSVLVPRNHPVLMKCRGLVLREDGTVLCFPFERFFNWFEKEKTDIDWESAKVMEKLDGSLICVFWNGSGWEATTRGSFYPNKYGEEFDKKFWELFTNHGCLANGYCFMFEMCSSMNRIVTKYDKEFVSLIGIRDLNNLKEISAIGQSDCKNEIFGLNDIDDMRMSLENMPKDFEGFVVVDKNFNRLKIKNEEYLKLARIKALNERDIFDIVVKGEPIDTEFVHAFPEIEQRINVIKTEWETYQKDVHDTFDGLPYHMPRKIFAIEALKYPKIAGALFALLDNKDLREWLTWSAFERWME